MTNVELKAELRDIAVARAICKSIRATYVLTFGQIDTYYRVPSGKLKKRETDGEPTEYIFYERPIRASAKLSQFTIYSEEQARERFGSEPLPIWLTVKKMRELYMHSNVRIHLDIVDTLGHFIEFEALVSRDHPIEQCRYSVASLRQQFQPVLGEQIDCGYADLMAQEVDGTPLPRQEPGL